MQKLKVTNVPRWISEIHLKQYFNSCGHIVDASIALDPNTLRPLGHGFLLFAEDDATEKALAKNGSLLDGSVITVEIAVDVEELQEIPAV